ncbi:MAG: copper resistance protein B [Nitrospira sp.]|nr:copper resistance protein B [Nitrospira sp.]
MVHFFSQLCRVVGQRQTRHRTHCPDNLTEGEEQDRAEESHPSFGKYPTIHEAIACLSAERAVKLKNCTYAGLSFDRSFGETATLVRQQGGVPSQIRFVVGVRMWF